MGIIVKPKTFVDNETLLYTDLNSLMDTVYNEFNGSISNANIDDAAAISPTKVSGTAVTLDGVETLTNKTITSPTLGGTLALNQSWDGWIVATDTWTYASASTFTISGVDRTSIYATGTKLKFTQTTVKYAVVASSSFSTNTTVTIIVNTDYTIANAAITSPKYSYADNPQGFPASFAFTPTTNGFSSAPTGQLGSYTVSGRRIFVTYYEVGRGTSNSTSYTKNLPIAAAAVGTNMGIVGKLHGAADGGTYLTVTSGNGEAPPTCYLVSGGSVVVLSRAAGALDWTNSGEKGCTYLSIDYTF